MATTPKSVWAGRVLALPIALLFGMSAFMKLRGGPELTQGMAHMGLPETLVQPLAWLELACLLVYLVPQTAVVGAILLTGYLGGAICTHWRVGDPFVVQVALGVCVWLSLWLRDARVRQLMPLVRP